MSEQLEAEYHSAAGDIPDASINARIDCIMPSPARRPRKSLIRPVPPLTPVPSLLAELFHSASSPAARSPTIQPTVLATVPSYAFGML